MNNRFFFTQDKEKKNQYNIIDSETWEIVSVTNDFQIANAICKDLNNKGD